MLTRPLVAPQPTPIELAPQPKPIPSQEDIDYWGLGVAEYMRECRSQFGSYARQLTEEATRWRDRSTSTQQDLDQARGDLRQANEQCGQLEQELVKASSEIEDMRRSQAALQAQLQAAHDEVIALRNSNVELRGRLARIGPELADSERPTLEAKISESANRLVELNELKARRETDRALIAQLHKELQAARSAQGAESAGPPRQFAELTSEIQKALLALVTALVIRAGAWAARSSYHREYLAKESFLRHLLVKLGRESGCDCQARLASILSGHDMTPDITPVEEVTKALAMLECGNFVLPYIADPPLPNEEADSALLAQAREERDHRGVRRMAVIAHKCLDPEERARVLLTQIWPGLVANDEEMACQQGGVTATPLGT
jgi:hypothetical protein